MSYLDPERIQAETWVSFVEYHETLESTNTLAAELRAPLQQHAPALVIADRQTAGRGRGQHAWWSDGGALTFSVVLDTEQHGPEVEFRPLVALAVGLAVRATVAEHLPIDRQAQIKWPNDVLVDGLKICGILCEQHATDHGNVLVLGIGLNVNNSVATAPEDVRRRATSLFDLTGQSYDLTAVLIRLLNQLQHFMEQLCCSPPDIVRQAGEHHRLTGQTISIDTPARTLSGVCQGIAIDGALLLDVDGAVIPVHAGSIEEFS